MKKLFALSSLLVVSSLFGQVTITKPSLTFSACTYPSSYILLGTIKIDETVASDFGAGVNRTFIISAPANFEFQPGIGSVQVTNGGNLKSETITVTSSTATVSFESTGTNKLDGMTISGLKVRVLSAASGTFTRTSGSSSINGFSNGTALTNIISGQSLPENTYRTVTDVANTLNWNNAATWECGQIPPNDGTANVIISAYNGGYSVLNAVVFGNNVVKSITIESGANFSPPGNSGSKFVVNGNFTINLGGYFRQYNWAGSGKNSIEIKGDFTNDGEMTTTGSNNTFDLDITFNGTSAQTISGSGIFRMISNGSQTSTLSFNNEKGVTLSSSFSTQGLYGDAGAVVVDGVLTFGKSINQFTGAGSLTMNGTSVLKASTFYDHFAMTGSKTLGLNATIEYTNSISEIGSTNIPSMNLYRLISSVGDGSLTVANNLNVSDLLTIISGKIVLGVNTLTIGTSITNKGSISYTSGVVIGKMKRWFSGTNSGTSSGLFPLANDSGTKKKFITVEYTQATDGGTLTAEWIATPMGTNFINESINTNCNGSFEIYNTASGYWSMTPGDGITNSENKTYNITLSAEGLLDFTNDCHVTILKRQGTNPWLQSGMHVDNAGDAISPIAQRIGATGWSNWGFAGGSGTPLPVELTNFTIVCGDDSPILEWTTESEFNSAYFDIEQSIDGNNWITNDQVPAAGNSNVLLNYQFVLKSSNRYKYFRLKQVDIDGTEKIYGPLILNCTSKFNVISFPNPSNENFSVSIQSDKNFEDCKVTIMSMQGQVVLIMNKSIEIGSQLISFENLNLTSGTYLIEISSPAMEDPVILRQTIQ